MDPFACHVCRNDYDDTIRNPLKIEICGHSACQICIKNLIDNAKTVKLSFIRCPICDEQLFVNLKTENLFELFPKNTEFLTLLAPKLASTYCSIHKKVKKDFICVNPSCTINERFCIECCKNHPQNCQTKLILNEDKFWSMVKFPETNLKLNSNFETLKKSIKVELKNLENYIMSIIDSCDSKMNEDSNHIQKLKTDRNFFLKNKSDFIFRENSILTELEFEYRFEKSYQKFNQNIIEIFNTKIWSDVYKLIDFNILKFFDDSKKEISPVFPEHENLIARLIKMNPQIRNELILENFKHTTHFSFDRFFKNLSSKIDYVNVRFVEVESFLFDKDMKYFTQKSIQKAFSQTNLTSESISTSIANDFNEEYRSGFWNFFNGGKNYTWNTILQYWSDSSIKPGSKYIRLKNDKFYLIIFTKE